MGMLNFAACFAAIVALASAFNAARLWSILIYRVLFIYSLALLFTSISFLLFSRLSNIPARMVLGGGYFFLILLSISLFLYALIVVQRSRWIRFSNLLVLGFGPLAAFYIIVFGPPTWFDIRGFQEINATLIPNGLGMGLIGLFHNVILYVSTLFLIPAYLGDNILRKWSGLLVIGLLLPMVANLTGLIGWNLSWHLPFLLLSYSLTGVILFGLGLLKTTPLLREVIIEKMHLPWMIVDDSDKIRDLNLAAEVVIGNRGNTLGQPVEKVLGNWSNIVDGTNETRELHLKGEGGGAGSQRQYFDLTALPILDRSGQGQGRLLIWRDITDQKIQEIATQRARDEMFGLLYSISGAASQAQNVNDFLTASIVQIANIFEYDYGAVFLASEDYSEGDGQTFLLAAQYGLSPEAEKNMSLISGELLLSEMNENIPILIKDVSTDERVPKPMRAMGNFAMLIVPMAVDENLIGFITLMKSAADKKVQEDLTRLDVVGKQVANFVNGERSRELAISLAERQKLVRDLHDSVTQKLYGLIALTEAAEAGKEAGSMDMLFKVLPKISENARQALKEMRLFLHQLQPVDLEHEGLQYVLHQRLAAVEGRADINARFVCDEEIDLSLDKEVALYYIAEEALNNVLKHARAQTVGVHLRQSRQNVLMEIEDDGCGFDPSQVRVGGMGLQNMRHRAATIQAKLKIISAVDQGTRVTITVERDRIRAQQKR